MHCTLGLRHTSAKQGLLGTQGDHLAAFIAMLCAPSSTADGKPTSLTVRSFSVPML